MFISATLIATSVNAQDDRDKISVGVKAGINSANVYDTQGEEFNADARIGMAGGIFVSIPIGTFLGFQPELLFSQKGYQSTYKILGDYSYTKTLNYIDVPLLIALKPSSFVTILAGPQYSYLMKQKVVFKNPIADAVIEEKFTNDNLRKNTFGFVGGLDINLSDFVIGARVSWDITNNNGDGTVTNPRYKNVVGQLTLGYRFN